jgi:outer membrane protein OmpA-like peptidoglycan-associated protein
MGQLGIGQRSLERTRVAAATLAVISLPLPAVLAAMVVQLILYGGIALVYFVDSPPIQSAPQPVLGRRATAERVVYVSATRRQGNAAALTLADGSDSASVLMEGASSEMHTAARARVDAAARQLLALPGARLVITGESSAPPSKQSLGENDAAVVRRRLIDGGVPPARLITQLNGAPHPQCAAKDVACRTARRFIWLRFIADH